MDFDLDGAGARMSLSIEQKSMFNRRTLAFLVFRSVRNLLANSATPSGPNLPREKCR